MPLRPPAGFVSANYDPLKNPDAPTGVAASGGDTQATVSFSAPANPGGSAISAYFAVSNPDRITVSGATSPITVTGLTNGTPYTFQVWALNSYGPGAFSAASGSVTPALPRGLFAGGETNTGFSSSTSKIEYISISSTGSSTNFGNLRSNTSYLSSCASSTRGIFTGGVQNMANLDYVTIATTGNSLAFGSLVTPFYFGAGCSSATRGIFGGGDGVNVIQYITIASTGNSLDFGDLFSPTYGLAACSSNTRGVFAGGVVSGGGGTQNVIQYITIATTGNSIDFGDLTSTTHFFSGCSSATRGVFGGGVHGASYNVIQYITIATTGNAIDFGDLTVRVTYNAACSSLTTGIFSGGIGQLGESSTSSIINSLTIASTGNAIYFGNLISPTAYLAGCSNGHGGLA